MVRSKHVASIAAVLGLATIGVAAMPHAANAWWRGGYGVGIWIPPVVVAPPPPVYYAPPVVAYGLYAAPYYVAPRRVWIRPHWEGPYWVRGHWS